MSHLNLKASAPHDGIDLIAVACCCRDAVAADAGDGVGDEGGVRGLQGRVPVVADENALATELPAAAAAAAKHKTKQVELAFETATINTSTTATPSTSTATTTAALTTAATATAAPPLLCHSPIRHQLLPQHCILYLCVHKELHQLLIHVFLRPSIHKLKHNGLTSPVDTQTEGALNEGKKGK